SMSERSHRSLHLQWCRGPSDGAVPFQAVSHLGAGPRCRAGCQPWDKDPTQPRTEPAECVKQPTGCRRWRDKHKMSRSIVEMTWPRGQKTPGRLEEVVKTWKDGNVDVLYS